MTEIRTGGRGREKAERIAYFFRSPDKAAAETRLECVMASCF
jgi:hypothetical protein